MSAGDGRQSFWSLSRADLSELLTAWGEPPYRGDQVWTRAYRRFAASFEEATELSRELRQRLDAGLALRTLEPVLRQQTVDASTRKLVLRLHDDLTIETVLMLYPPAGGGRPRATICVSSQAGCAMGCVFCATGQQGFERHLTAAEIVEQVVIVAGEFAREDGRVTNIVFMGMGEPLHNYDETLAAVRRLHDPAGFGLGARHMTLSTVGLVPGILRLAEEPLQVGLAVSLHAPDDELRRRIVPSARRYSLEQILDACRQYMHRSGRRVTFEYCLMAGINDSVEQARALATRLADLHPHVNLIPVNPTDNPEIRRPSRSRVLAFERALREAGIACTVRVEKGIEIAAGCGQLRGRDGTPAPQGLRLVAPPSG